MSLQKINLLDKEPGRENRMGEGVTICMETRNTMAYIG